ncbi:MAG TPA: hypothetical protein VFT32_06620 [Candidatus Eisenbacteria bacterium]|nr:hypothetical protein [Candidatus Eisenbacteria bacterium]
MNCKRRWFKGLWVSLQILVLGLAAGAIAGGCASTTSTPFEEGADRYRFEIALERARGETGSCTGRVSVTDRASKRAIVIPAFSAPWGRTTTASMADTTYGATLTATLAVTPDGTSGTCHAVLRRGERLLASRKATFPVKVTATAPNIRY